ncbi:glycosyltransferase [Candidatus Bathyarchaeota archaeon]|nr:glycosyltransferase [Candidatus Bathyarchaeota archaeon]
MKVCAVTTWPPHREGIALYSAHLYGEMKKIVDVSVIANIINSSAVEALKSDGENIRVIRCWRRGSLTYPFKIFRRVLMENPDIIHVQHGWLLYGDAPSSILFPVLLVLLRLIGKPCIVTMHTVIKRGARLYRNKLINLLALTAIYFITRLTVKLSSIIIVHNPLVKETLEEKFSLKKFKEKIIVIPHGARRANVFRKTSISGKNRGNIVILSLGFARKGRGIECLIEAFKKFLEQHPSSTFIITGGQHAHDKGNPVREVRRKIPPEMLGKIVFTDFIDEEVLDRLILESDIIVLSSIEDYFIEASGALARVALFGKPVVCSKVPKFEAELKNGENCIMFKPGDSEELAKILKLLTGNPNLREKIGRKLEASFRNREWGLIAERYVDFFQSLVEESKS